MSVAGKVCTGFSKPYVAKYTKGTDAISYSSGQLLARGVSVTASPETSDDNDFYADNIIAEKAAGVFNGGTLNLTVDGLFSTAEKLIMGLTTADSAGFIHYGDDQQIPDVGVGFIARYQSEGAVSYTPVIFPRVTFNMLELTAATQDGEEIDWQTQELTANIKRAEDDNRNWKYVGGDETSESAAEAKIKTFLAIS